jgi:hypothetical protein
MLSMEMWMLTLESWKLLPKLKTPSGDVEKAYHRAVKAPLLPWKLTLKPLRLILEP